MMMERLNQTWRPISLPISAHYFHFALPEESFSDQTHWPRTFWLDARLWVGAWKCGALAIWKMRRKGRAMTGIVSPRGGKETLRCKTGYGIEL
jgi:hypothetical protein